MSTKNIIGVGVYLKRFIFLHKENNVMFKEQLIFPGLYITDDEFKLFEVDWEERDLPTFQEYLNAYKSKLHKAYIRLFENILDEIYGAQTILEKFSYFILTNSPSLNIEEAYIKFDQELGQAVGFWKLDYNDFYGISNSNSELFIDKFINHPEILKNLEQFYQRIDHVKQSKNIEEFYYVNGILRKSQTLAHDTITDILDIVENYDLDFMELSLIKFSRDD